MIFRPIYLLCLLARYGTLFVLRPAGAAYYVALPLTLMRRWNLPKSRGSRLALALEAMGPAFVKLGQALSMRTDIVGEDVAQDLSRLRDRLPPFPAATARKIVERELGKSMPELFSSFDDTPVAAASIAQVHFAVTKDGKEVAVKILRPGIEKRFAKDLKLFRRVAEWMERRVKAAKRLRPVEVVSLLEQMVAFELDLRMEAAAADDLREYLHTGSDILIPAVHWPLTARRVMTMERVYGTPLSDVETLRARGDAEEILRRIVAGFLEQAFEWGAFHGDLHAGNIFVTDAGKIALVDFGIVGRLDRKSRLVVAEIFRGFLTGDFRRVAEVHFEAGYVPEHQSVEEFALACRAIAKPVLGRPLNEVSFATLLAQLFQVTARFEMQTQPQLLLLQKNMMLLEGIGRMLKPDVNLWQLAEPVLEAWVREHLGLEAKLREAFFIGIETLKSLPDLLSRLNRTVH